MACFFPCTILVCVHPSCLCILYTTSSSGYIYMSTFTAYFCYVLLRVFSILCPWNTFSVLSHEKTSFFTYTPTRKIFMPRAKKKESTREKERKELNTGMNFLLLYTHTHVHLLIQHRRVNYVNFLSVIRFFIRFTFAVLL